MFSASTAGSLLRKGKFNYIACYSKVCNCIEKKIKKEGIRLVDRYNMNEYLIGVQCKKVIL